MPLSRFSELYCRPRPHGRALNDERAGQPVKHVFWIVPFFGQLIISDQGGLMKLDSYEEIPIESLTPSRSKGRVLCPAKEIAKLAQSIKKLGLLTPIIVAPASIAGKYEIVIGRRRFLAVQTLGWAKIFAVILDQRPNDTQMRAILLTESQQNQLLQREHRVRTAR
jgi:hypothetical protein